MIEQTEHTDTPRTSNHSSNSIVQLTEEVTSLQAELSQLASISRRLSNGRLVTFLALLFGLLGSFDNNLYLAFVALPALVAFATLFVLHDRVRARERAIAAELTLTGERRQRLRRECRPASEIATPDPASRLGRGERTYAPERESYPLDDHVSDDLQLETGRRNLLAFLDWTSTTFGSIRLRRLLRQPLRHVEDLKARQLGVDEIAKKGDARKEILLALLPLRAHNLSPLGGLLGESQLFPRKRGLSVLSNLTGTLAPLAVILIAFTGRLELALPLVILIIINFGIIGANVADSNRARDRFLLLGPLLDAWTKMRTTFVKAAWESSEWKDIHTTLDTIHPAVRRLRRYVQMLSFHSYGVIFEIVNVLTLWELRILPLVDGIVRRHHSELEMALSAVAEAESLICLALPLSEQQGFAMPEAIESEQPRVSARAVGHPLLTVENCERNPIEIGDNTNVWIVTGSNMSGKSTYLKTVGVNLVLAGAGAAVCGDGFRWTPMAIHSDMNVRDSLDDGKSYFQIEVERVLQTLSAASNNPKLIAIFDELFRGTNSDERLAISRAVVRHLRSSGALLLIATHDLDLTRLVTDELEPGIENCHLRDTIKDDAMHFDYVLHRGSARGRNAVRVIELHRYPESVVKEAREFLERQTDESS